MGPRIAVLGAGYWGKNLLRNFHELGSLAVICEADVARHDELRRQYPSCKVTADVSEVLSDSTLEGVAISTPAETHGRLVREAILAGKDVFVEKPLCLSVEEGKTLVDLAREKKRILMVGHLLWYHPAVLKLKQLVDEGKLGRIQYVYSNRLNLGKIRREENILWSFAPHDVSVILGLLGEMPEQIQAQGGNYLHPNIADTTVTLLSFPSGVKAHIYVSWLHPFKEQKLIVVGDKQMAVFNDQEPKDKLLLYPTNIEWRGQTPVAGKTKGEPVPQEILEPLQNECSHFLTCIESRSQPRTDGQEGLRVLTVLDRCQKALDAPSAPTEPESPHLHYKAHPSAFIDDGVEIGEGTTIWHVSHIIKGSKIGRNCRIGQNVVIGPHASVGDGCKIQNNVSIYEGVTLEDYVFCGPSMVFTNVYNPRCEVPRMNELRKTLVRRGATLGANCTILCGVTIGSYALVGAGAVVLKDVPDYAVVVGNPAKAVGWACKCGITLRLQDTSTTVRCNTCKTLFALDQVGAPQEVQEKVQSSEQ